MCRSSNAVGTKIFAPKVKSINSLLLIGLPLGVVNGIGTRLARYQLFDRQQKHIATLKKDTYFILFYIFYSFLHLSKKLNRLSATLSFFARLWNRLIF
jgi:hypothetical protein